MHVTPIPAFNVAGVGAETVQALARVQQLSAGFVKLELEIPLCCLIGLSMSLASGYPMPRAVPIPEPPPE